MEGNSVVIVDYGLGNLFSVLAALKKIGVSDAVVTNDKRTIAQARKLILPGVGAFGDGMNKLRELDLISTIVGFAESGKAMLGVCLGMQLLMEESEEFGTHKGLNLIEGDVRKIQLRDESIFKIPIIGWRSLWPPQNEKRKVNDWGGTVLSSLKEGTLMYFLHSYVVEPTNMETKLAATHYGGISFASAIMYKNITGVQFHPERSGEEGLKIYSSFMANS